MLRMKANVKFIVVLYEYFGLQQLLIQNVLHIWVLLDSFLFVVSVLSKNLIPTSELY